MENINNLAQTLSEIDTEEGKINVNLQSPLTPEQLMAIESIKRIKNPFKMIGVEAVMQDLHICKTIAYRLFQRKDFPSINIGKNNQVMILPYMMWKMQKRD